MKRTLLYITLILLVFSSCREENYDLDIDSSDPILIVDARVKSSEGKLTVKLTESTEFLGTNPEAYVDDANVFISINNSDDVNVDFVEDGLYELDGIEVSEGTVYKLKIVRGDKEYEAETEMLNVVDVPFFIFEETAGFSSDTLKKFGFNMILDIDLAQTNYYLTEAEVRSSIIEQTVGDDNRLHWDDGAYSDNPALFPFFVADYYAFDSVSVSFSHINLETYEFYNSLSEVGGQNPSDLAPSNPISNISNGAIGNFGAFATFDTTIVVFP